MDRSFYLYWSVGFLFYGVNIFLRLWVASTEVSTLGLLAFVLNTVGFILIMTGIGELVDKARATLLVTIIIQASLTLLGLFAGSSAVAWLALLSPHILIVLSLCVIYYRYHVDISLILIGWVPIFAVNLALAFGALDIVYVDLVSAVSKLVVYRGMSEPTFSELADSLHEFLLGGIATEYENERIGGFYLVELGSASRAREIQWIKRRVGENRRRGVRTVLFSFYDQITSGDVLKENRGDLFLVRVLQGQTGLMNVFDIHETTVSDNPSHIRIMLQDIVEASLGATAPAEVIVYSLSNAIHMHGWNRLYALITSMKLKLEESSVNLVCFIHPETHREEAVTAKFELLADGVIRE